MVWSSLMTTLDILGLSSLPTRVCLLGCLRYFAKEYKDIMSFISQVLKVTMIPSSKMEHLRCFVSLMAYITISLHQEHLTKMRLWNERIKISRR